VHLSVQPPSPLSSACTLRLVFSGRPHAALQLKKKKKSDFEISKGSRTYLLRRFFFVNRNYSCFSARMRAMSLYSSLSLSLLAWSHNLLFVRGRCTASIRHQWHVEQSKNPASCSEKRKSPVRTECVWLTPPWGCCNSCMSSLTLWPRSLCWKNKSKHYFDWFIVKVFRLKNKYS